MFSKAGLDLPVSGFHECAIDAETQAEFRKGEWNRIFETTDHEVDENWSEHLGDNTVPGYCEHPEVATKAEKLVLNLWGLLLDLTTSLWSDVPLEFELYGPEGKDEGELSFSLASDRCPEKTIRLLIGRLLKGKLWELYTDLQKEDVDLPPEVLSFNDPVKYSYEKTETKYIFHCHIDPKIEVAIDSLRMFLLNHKSPKSKTPRSAGKEREDYYSFVLWYYDQNGINGIQKDAVKHFLNSRNKKLPNLKSGGKTKTWNINNDNGIRAIMRKAQYLAGQSSYSEFQALIKEGKLQDAFWPQQARSRAQSCAQESN